MDGGGRLDQSLMRSGPSGVGEVGAPSAGLIRPPTAAAATSESADVNGLIAGAAADLAAYQRLTAEGKLGEAGQRLDALKQKLDQLAKRR